MFGNVFPLAIMQFFILLLVSFQRKYIYDFRNKENTIEENITGIYTAYKEKITRLMLLSYIRLKETLSENTCCYCVSLFYTKANVLRHVCLAHKNERFFQSHLN